MGKVYILPNKRGRCRAEFKNEDEIRCHLILLHGLTNDQIDRALRFFLGRGDEFVTPDNIIKKAPEIDGWSDLQIDYPKKKIIKYALESWYNQKFTKCEKKHIKEAYKKLEENKSEITFPNIISTACEIYGHYIPKADREAMRIRAANFTSEAKKRAKSVSSIFRAGRLSRNLSRPSEAGPSEPGPSEPGPSEGRVPGDLEDGSSSSTCSSTSTKPSTPTAPSVDPSIFADPLDAMPDLKERSDWKAPLCKDYGRPPSIFNGWSVEVENPESSPRIAIEPAGQTNLLPTRSRTPGPYRSPPSTHPTLIEKVEIKEKKTSESSAGSSSSSDDGKPPGPSKSPSSSDTPGSSENPAEPEEEWPTILQSLVRKNSLKYRDTRGRSSTSNPSRSSRNPTGNRASRPPLPTRPPKSNTPMPTEAPSTSDAPGPSGTHNSAPFEAPSTSDEPTSSEAPGSSEPSSSSTDRKETNNQ